jgi:SNF2 family DNA or RNA helicase
MANYEDAKLEVELGKVRVEDWMMDFGIQSRAYQQNAINWTLYKEQGLFFDEDTEELSPTTSRGLVGDEMGLGKTIVMLATWVGNPLKNTLVVVPSALLDQWDKLLFKWLGFNPLVFHGKNAKLPIEVVKSNQIVLTTYGMISLRSKKKKNSWKSPLWGIEWDRVIYDEAHHLRNKSSNKHLGAKKIQAKIQWYMSGTPIQNSGRDLDSLCDLMGILKQMQDEPLKAAQILRPYVKLRTKEQVGIELPPAEIETIEITEYDSTEEREFIRSVHSRLPFSQVTVDNVNDFVKYLEGINVLPMLTRARQACVIPDMLSNTVSEKMASIFEDTKFEKPNVHTHTKINLIVEKIIVEKREGRRCLVFCHYVDEMDLIKSILVNREGMDVKMLNGNTTGRDRKTIPTMKPDVLIVQIQSCCEGLNLQQFSTVIFTSPHWNPAVEDQAIARAHRIGQTEQVRVFRYIVAGLGDATISIDARCKEVQDMKREKMINFAKEHTKKIYEPVPE